MADHSEQSFSTEEQQQFRAQGFLVVRGMADAALVERMRAIAVEQLERGVGPVEYEADTGYPGAPASREAPGGGAVRRLLAAHSRGIEFTRWLMEPALRGRIRSLLGEEVYVPLAHHNCIMTKQPGYSSDTGWHQDVRYWSFQRGELVNAWLALGAEGERSGALRLIPGSQRVPLQPEQFDGRKFFRDDLPENRTLIDTHVVAELSGGDVLFFDARCLHAASRNYTEQTKYSVVFSFRPADNPPIAGTRSTSLPELRLP